MGFLAPAAPIALPLLIGAGVGGVIDKGNPLRGALLGALGGSFLGPAMSGLTSGGAAASEAALGAGMGEAAASAAAPYAAAAEITGAGFSPMQAAMLAEQTSAFGAPGLASTLQSAGINTIPSKLASMATLGPQGLMQGMSGKDMLLKGGKMLAQNVIQGQPQQAQMMPPPPAAGGAPRMPAMPPQRVSPFVTGMPSMSQRRRPEDDPRYRMWG